MVLEVVRQLVRLLAIDITQLKVEHAHKVGGNDVLLELRKSHAQTGVAAGAPPVESAVGPLRFWT